MNAAHPPSRSPQADRSIAPASRHRPIGVGTVAIALGAAVVSYGVTVTALISMESDAATAGVAAYLVSGLAPLAAVLLTYWVHTRDLAALGFRKVSFRWIAIGAGAGVGAILLSILVTLLVVSLSGPPSDIQADYAAAASGGPALLAATLIAGAILTPLGEELLFRGVLTNWLLRIGGWVAIPVGAGLFALSHGINYILPVAFIIGVIAGLLFRATGSIWPGVTVHAVNNGYVIVSSAIVASL